MLRDKKMKKICVFAGSQLGLKNSYSKVAKELGKQIAKNQMIIIYGGGSRGLMGVMANAALEAKGRVEGVITKKLHEIEVGHSKLTELTVVSSMHERKAIMAERSDAIICLPGGVGTWEEFFEAMAWNQLGIHSKPIILLNISKYYSPLYSFVKKSVTEGFLPSTTLEDLFLIDNITKALNVIMKFKKKDLLSWNKRFNLN